MLGKGLESLIPKKDPQGGNTPAPGDVTPVDPSSYPPHDKAHEEEPRVFVRAIHEGEGERYRAGRDRGGTAVFQIEVEKIKPNPFQPRRDFNEDSLRELADSIREFGVIQPIIVTKIEREVPTGTDVEYELIAGERRWLAAKMLGLPRVPAIVRTVDFPKERLELAIIENLQRENLNPLEVARGYARLQDEFRLTQREIATRIGKSREAVANTLRLLDLPSHIQDAIAKREISESHGRLLLAVQEKNAQEALFKDMTSHRMTTRELKSRVQGMRVNLGDSSGTSEEFATSPEIKMIEEALSAELGAPVEIQSRAREGGKITIRFFSPEELKGIVERFKKKEER